MRLYGTPPSHFTRKVRVVLQELKIPYEFILLDKLLETGEEKFAHNPLHMFPVLENANLRLFESDLICEYLIEQFDKNNVFGSFLPVPEKKIPDLQRLAVMNGGMSSGVTLIRAKRSGIEPWSNYAYFRQELASIQASLHWLERDLSPSRTLYHAEKFSMLEVTLMCFLEWADFRGFIESWAPFPNLHLFLMAHRDRPSFKSTHPALPEGSP